MVSDRVKEERDMQPFDSKLDWKNVKNYEWIKLYLPVIKTTYDHLKR